MTLEQWSWELKAEAGPQTRVHAGSPGRKAHQLLLEEADSHGRMSWGDSDELCLGVTCWPPGQTRGLSPSEMARVWASCPGESGRLPQGPAPCRPLGSPGRLQCQVGVGSGRRGVRALGKTGCGLCSLSQKELGPSNIPPSVDLRCHKTTKPNQSHQGEAGPPTAGSLCRASSGNAPIFLVWQELASPVQQLCRPGPGKEPIFGFLYSFWKLLALSPKLKQNWGTHSCLPLERLSWPQHASLHLTNLVVSPASSLPPHSALALLLCRLLLSGRVSACFKVPSPLWTAPPSVGSPHPWPGLAPSGLSLRWSGVPGEGGRWDGLAQAAEVAFGGSGSPPGPQ